MKPRIKLEAIVNDVPVSERGLFRIPVKVESGELLDSFSEVSEEKRAIFEQNILACPEIYFTGDYYGVYLPIFKGDRIRGYMDSGGISSIGPMKALAIEPLDRDGNPKARYLSRYFSD